jgi:hypothetical protein
MVKPCVEVYGADMTRDGAKVDTIEAKGPAGRFRSSLWDLAVLVAVLLVGAYLMFKYDIFRGVGGVVRGKTIELDEGLLLGGVMALGLVVFAVRRLGERRRGAAGRLATEEYVQSPAFQKALSGMTKQREREESLRALRADTDKK